jgi:hypothetical protein
MNGKVEVKLDGKQDENEQPSQRNARQTAQATLTSVVADRLAGDFDNKLPCAFGDDKDSKHPQGRLVIALKEGMNASFRIRDQQTMLVERRFKSVASRLGMWMVSRKSAAPDSPCPRWRIGSTTTNSICRSAM